MNRRYTLLLLVALTTSAFGQTKVNPRLSKLEDFLRQQPHGVGFSQRNLGSDYITYRWYAQLDGIGRNKKKPVITKDMSKEEMVRTGQQIDSINAISQREMEDAIDSIRIAFTHVRKEATESYMYEYHKDCADTIHYSLVSRYDNAYEVAKLRSEMICDRHKLGSYGWWYRSDPETDSIEFFINGMYQGPFAHYDHSYEELRGISKEEMKPFDIAAFETHIQPALEPLMKLQGAKSYPVYWQHDKGYEDEVGSYGNLLYGQRIVDIWPAGVTTGTYYFIPAQHKAEPIVDRLDSLAYDYVNHHPEQPYIYDHIPIIPRLDNRYGSVYLDVFHHVNDMVESDSDELDLNSTKYNLRCYQDDDGLHILSLTTKGLLWIPKGFQKMKRWVNGKATYRKN